MIAALGCAAPEARTFAHYRDSVLTESDYRGWLAFHDLKDDENERLSQARRMALSTFLAAEATAAGLDQRPAVRLAIEDRTTRTLERAVKRHNAADVEIDPAAIDARYAERRAALLARPRRVRLRNLYKAFPTDASEAARTALREEMASIRRSIVEGADFATVAAETSESQTRHRGGLIGIVKPGELRPEIDEVAMSLQAGALSEIIETDDGLTLLLADEVIDGKVPKNLRQRAEEALRRERVQTKWRALRTPWRARVAVDAQPLLDPAADDDTPVVAIDGEPALTAGDARHWLRVRGMRQAPTDLAPETLQELLETFGLERCAAAYAREQKLDRDPDTRGVLTWGRIAILATEALKVRVQKAFTPPTDDEVRAAFEAQAETYAHAEQFRAYAILQRATAATVRERYRQMQAIADDIAAGRLSFEEAARIHSELPSATRGGDLGWLTRKQAAGFGPTAAKVFVGLGIGETSDLVQQKETMGGAQTFWILRKAAHRPRRPATFEEVRERVHNDVAQARVRTLQAEISTALLGELAVSLAE